MIVPIDIPDAAAGHFGKTPEAIGRNLLVKAALEDYREGRVSEGRFAEIIGVSRWEAQELLDQHSLRKPYSLDMLHEDRRSFGKSPGKR
jgi:predicted HTH domain antitoxin